MVEFQGLPVYAGKTNVGVASSEDTKIVLEVNPQYAALLKNMVACHLLVGIKIVAIDNHPSMRTNGYYTEI